MVWMAFSSMMQWAAVQPPLDGILATLATTQAVQAISSTILGTTEVPPVMLLSVIVGCLISYMMFLLTIPKGRLAIWAFWYFFLSSDKKCNKPQDNMCDMNAPSCKKMKIVFIRHGESEWNAVFNEGTKLMMPIRLVVALFKEARMLFDQDSLFMDSPLSEIGVDQAWKLMSILASAPAMDISKERASLPVEKLEVNEIISIIRGDLEKNGQQETMMVSSNLRRAISTGLIALSPRLLKTPAHKDKVQIMTHLQEISRNMDTLALAPAKTQPQIPRKEAELKYMGDVLAHFYKTRLDIRHYTGNKSLKQKAIKRQDAFVKWLLTQCGNKQTENNISCVIVFGHSLWFQEFFKSYLPKSAKHQAKTCKIKNGGCIAFDFYYDSKKVGRIPSDSIKSIHGGFIEKGKKSKTA